MARTSASRFRFRTVVRTSMARRQQLQNAMAADEARAAGDQNRAHDGLLMVRCLRPRHMVLRIASLSFGDSAFECHEYPIRRDEPIAVAVPEINRLAGAGGRNWLPL